MAKPPGSRSAAGTAQRESNMNFLAGVGGGRGNAVTVGDLSELTKGINQGLSRRAARTRVRNLNRRRAGG
jgi:hypothetical protein